MRLGEKPLKNKPVYVLDATPVIIFAKIGKLELLSEISDMVITVTVMRETTSGDYPDALIIKEATERGILRVYDDQDRNIVDALLSYKGVHKGEAETLAAAKLLDGVAIVDDAEARSLAKVYGINTAPGSVFLLFRLLVSGKIDSFEAEEMLEKMVKSGLYLDPRTLLRAREKIRNRLMD
jgi:predicted nucleic acid-binding protein